MPTKVRAPRSGTKRAKIVQLMSRPGGATAAALRRATGWDQKTLADGVRLVRVACGYPVVQEDDTYVIRPPRKRARQPRPPASAAS